MFTWNGTQLGVKTDKDAEYIYVDLKGDRGDNFEYIWNGTSLGVKTDKDLNFVYVNLKGDKGSSSFEVWQESNPGGTLVQYNAFIKGETGYSPIKGTDYFDGDSFMFTWQETSLGIKTDKDLNYTFTELKGDKGDKGDSFEFNWIGTQLGVKTDKDTAYAYVDLKGDKGDVGDMPTAAIDTYLGNFYSSSIIALHRRVLDQGATFARKLRFAQEVEDETPNASLILAPVAVTRQVNSTQSYLKMEQVISQ